MDHHKGHRQRLIERYSNNGLSGLHDYEVLELLLTFVFPRRDTKGIAKTLLQKYKTISAMLAAPQSELEELEGLGQRSITLLKFIRDISSHCLQEQFHQKEFISSQRDVKQYLKFHFAHLRTEYAVVLYMDNQNRVITSSIEAEGTVDHCTIYPRNIFDRAFRCEAAGILLAHNHPGGSSEVSNSDWQLTERIHKAGTLLNIQLLDHIIITDRELVSLRGKAGWPN